MPPNTFKCLFTLLSDHIQFRTLTQKSEIYPLKIKRCNHPKKSQTHTFIFGINSHCGKPCIFNSIHLLLSLSRFMTIGRYCSFSAIVVARTLFYPLSKITSFCLGRKGWPRSEPTPKINVCYNSML